MIPRRLVYEYGPMFVKTYYSQFVPMFNVRMPTHALNGINVFQINILMTNNINGVFDFFNRLLPLILCI